MNPIWQATLQASAAQCDDLSTPRVESAVPLIPLKREIRSIRYSVLDSVKFAWAAWLQEERTGKLGEMVTVQMSTMPSLVTTAKTCITENLRRDTPTLRTGRITLV